MKKVKVIFISIFMLFSISSMAQWGGDPGVHGQPVPGGEPGGYHPGGPHRPFGPEQGPIGTATALMLGCGAGYCAYKMKKNQKNKD